MIIQVIQNSCINAHCTQQNPLWIAGNLNHGIVKVKKYQKDFTLCESPQGKIGLQIFDLSEKIRLQSKSFGETRIELAMKFWWF